MRMSVPPGYEVNDPGPLAVGAKGIVRDWCLHCQAPVEIDTDGQGGLVEFEPGGARKHVCPGSAKRGDR